MNPLRVCVISMWCHSAVINMLYLLYARHFVCSSSEILPIKPERTERVWPTSACNQTMKIHSAISQRHRTTRIFYIFSQTFSEAFSHSLILLLGWSNAFNTHTHTLGHVQLISQKGREAWAVSTLSLLPHACHCILFLTAEHIVDAQSSPHPPSTLSLSSSFK